MVYLSSFLSIYPIEIPAIPKTDKINKNAAIIITDSIS